MKSHRVLALVAVLAAAPASAEEPAQLLVTATTSHLLPSARSAQALLRKLSPTTADIKIEAMAGVFLGLDAAMAEAFEGPVDVAVLRGENGDMVGLGAVALAWKDPSKLRGLGAPNAAGVRSVPVDATPLLAQLGAPNAVGAGGACALHPSPVAPGYRLVCAQDAATLAKLGPYLASDVALEPRVNDVAARVPATLFQDAAKSAEPGAEPSPTTPIERAANDELSSVGRDMASAALGVGWDPSSLSFAVDVRFKAQSAATTRLLLSARGCSKPVLFDRLPSDTLFFSTMGGYDPSLAREVVQKGISLAVEGAPSESQVAVAIVRPLADAIASQGFASTLVIGLDAKRALVGVEALKKKPKDAALQEKAARGLSPWVALEATGLQAGGSLVESVMALNDTAKAYAPAKGGTWPDGAKGWKMDDGSVIASVPTASSLLVVFGSSGAIVDEKLKTLTGGAGPRLLLADETRDAFNERPAMVAVVTDHTADLVRLSVDDDALNDTLKALREDVKKKDAPVQIPVRLSVKSGSAETGWLGTVRIEARYPVKALQAITKGAKKLSVSPLLTL